MQSTSLNDVIRLLNIAYIETYLKSRSWHIDEDGDVKIFSLENEYRQIILPNKKISDLEKVLHLTIELLSSIENRSQSSIVNDILNYYYDIFKVKLSNTPHIIDGSTIVDNLKDVFKSVAMSLECHKSLHSRISKKSEELLKKTLLGQTEIGSYIFTFLTPLKESLDLNDERLEPYERKFTNKVYSSLYYAKEVAETIHKTNDYKIINDYIKYGINANLCDSIANLFNIDGEINVTFDMIWSGLITQVEEKKRPIEFSRNLAPVLTKSSEFLKENLPFDIENKGYVICLRKNSPEDDGLVVLLYEDVNNKNKQIIFSLDSPRYEIAIEAHRQFKMIKFSGLAKQINKRIHMETVYMFDIVENDLEVYYETPQKKDPYTQERKTLTR